MQNFQSNTFVPTIIIQLQYLTIFYKNNFFGLSKQLAFSLIFTSFQSHHLISNNFEMVSSSKRLRISFAGLPAQISYGGISCVTTLPIPITAPSPIVSPALNFTPYPIHTSFPIIVVSISLKFSCAKFFLITFLPCRKTGDVET